MATGAQFDGHDDTPFPGDAGAYGLDPAHAQPTTYCFGCHQALDPMREIFDKSYNWMYNYGDNAKEAPGYFSFHGVQGLLT
ncbi:MAG TPA: hypothetical protein VEN29_08690, partial [Casimicrobiaceae bacterium]|nr:hypothetical protein [Casimicrobiaceae bacterium]